MLGYAAWNEAFPADVGVIHSTEVAYLLVTQQPLV